MDLHLFVADPSFKDDETIIAIESLYNHCLKKMICYCSSNDGKECIRCIEFLKSYCASVITTGKSSNEKISSPELEDFIEWSKTYPDRVFVIEIFGREMDCGRCDRYHIRNGEEINTERAYFYNDEYDTPEKWAW